MKKKITIGAIVALIVMVIAFVGILNQMKEDDEGVIKIGAILPLSGPVSTMGIEIDNAFQIALETINEESDGHYKFKLITEDGKYSPKDSLSAFNKITKTNNVAGLISFGNATTSQLIPFVEQNKIPLLALGAGASTIPKLSDWVFRVWIPVELQAMTIAKYATEVMKLKNVAILALNDESGDDEIRVFTNQIMKHDGKILGVERYEMSEVNTRVQVTKLLALNPEAIFVVGFGPAYISSLNHIKELRYTGYVLADISLVASDQMSKIKSLEKVIFLDTKFATDLDNKKAKKFIEKYTKKFNTKPTIVAAFAYETLLLYHEALKKENTADKLRDGLLAIKDYNSIIGDIIFRSDGEIYFPLIVVSTDENRVLKVLNTEIGQSLKPTQNAKREK